MSLIDTVPAARSTALCEKTNPYRKTIKRNGLKPDQR